MSLLAKMFGKKGDKAPTPQEAIQRLRETEDMLQKKSDFLEKKIEQELAVARKNGTKNKRGIILISFEFQGNIVLLVHL
jgi:hypothetical protein